MKKRMLAIMMSALVAAGICSGVTVYADADSKTLTEIGRASCRERV